MTTKTLKALNGTIKKWEKIVAGTGADEGSTNCPLCKFFVDLPFCYGCPIADFTKESGCFNTPWSKWLSHQYNRHDAKTELRVHCPTCRELAEEELRFLKSLLPKKERP